MVATFTTRLKEKVVGDVVPSPETLRVDAGQHEIRSEGSELNAAQALPRRSQVDIAGE